MTLADTDYFERGLTFMWPHEGVYPGKRGYVNDPDDRGGETAFGISKRRYPNEDIKGLTFERAKFLYRRDFWDEPGFDRLWPGALAVKVFDTGINIGPPRSIRILQRALNHTGAERGLITPLEIDGDLGPATLNACEEIVGWHGLLTLLFAYCHQQWRYYDTLATNNPSQKKFIHGWGRRAHDLPNLN